MQLNFECRILYGVLAVTLSTCYGALQIVILLLLLLLLLMQCKVYANSQTTMTNKYRQKTLPCIA